MIRHCDYSFLYISEMLTVKYFIGDNGVLLLIKVVVSFSK